MTGSFQAPEGALPSEPEPFEDTTPILYLSGKWRELSTFDRCQIRLGGVVYPSSEHAYNAAKSLDEAEREWVRAAPTCQEAKNRGQKVTLRPEWDERVRLEVMEAVNRQKFERDGYRDLLLATGVRELFHGNGHGDRFWGVVGREQTGGNHLGKLLMKIREEIRDV